HHVFPRPPASGLGNRIPAGKGRKARCAGCDGSRRESFLATWTSRASPSSLAVAECLGVQRRDLAKDVDGQLAFVTGKRLEQLLVDGLGRTDQGVEQFGSLIGETQQGPPTVLLVAYLTDVVLLGKPADDVVDRRTVQ